jgi:RNA polymerase sigma factor (TIGR02999 family)
MGPVLADKAAITRLLLDWRGGDEAALEALTPAVYDELRRMAHQLFRSERGDHTMQATALVNEAFVRLIDVDVSWRDRAHFFALSARLMRRMLVDHANARRAEKRGGGVADLPYDDNLVADDEGDVGLLDLDQAISALGEIDPEKAELIELRFFGGLSIRELTEITGRSSSSIDRDLRMARAWLKVRLDG